MAEFYDYFKENMDALGLPAPRELYANAILAWAAVSKMTAALDLLGPTATVGEIIGATIRAEKMAVIAACSAAAYIGAVIGSIAVATGRVLGNGATINDALFAASVHKMDRPWLRPMLFRNPHFYQPQKQFANALIYRNRMMIA